MCRDLTITAVSEVVKALIGSSVQSTTTSCTHSYSYTRLGSTKAPSRSGLNIDSARRILHKRHMLGYVSTLHPLYIYFIVVTATICRYQALLHISTKDVLFVTRLL